MKGEAVRIEPTNNIGGFGHGVGEMRIVLDVIAKDKLHLNH